MRNNNFDRQSTSAATQASSIKTKAAVDIGATTAAMSLSLKSIFVFVTILAYLCFDVVEARKHHLEVRDDSRPYIALSTFGFYAGGHLDVKLSKLRITDEQPSDLFGLSLDKTTIDQMNPYLDSHQNKCILEEPSVMQRSGPILFFLLDLKNLNVKVQCSPEWKNLHIYRDRSLFPMYRGKRHSFAKVSDSTLFMQRRRRRDTAPHEEDDDDETYEHFDDANYEQPKVQPSATSSTALPPKAAPSVESANKASTAAVAKPSAVVEAAKAPADKSLPKAPSVELAQHKEPAVSPSAPLSQASPSVDLPKQPASVVPLPPKVQSNEEQKIKESPQKPESKEQALSKEHAAPAEPAHNPLPVSSEYLAAASEEHILPQHSLQLCKDFILPLTKTIVNGEASYSMSFSMLVSSLRDEGLYNLYFHACPNYRQQKEVSFDVDIEENNNGNFLSAGEMPLPALYFMMSLLFFLSGLFWVFILKKSKNTVYKIHYIMAVLVFLKSLSLMFHSINYHFIEIRGEHVEAWAILYYIAHLLKGAVLFITIVLIGTGWTFIKHILSDKDKKIFMIVIPLQVLANVAEIIIDESEESDVEFRTWRNIFIFVDLLCCGAILFPIVWSIRHLHEASATDGKAAINLRKLKLFRQFYIMIVCYIYFTRIIVYLLKMTVAFQYAWLDEMFHEMATYVFFVLTGYKFRPVPVHPYFEVGDEDTDDEVEVLTESGLTEGLHRTKAMNRNAPQSNTTIIEGNDEERENLITKRESSHEYD